MFRFVLFCKPQWHYAFKYDIKLFERRLHNINQNLPVADRKRKLRKQKFIFVFEVRFSSSVFKVLVEFNKKTAWLTYNSLVKQNNKQTIVRQNSLFSSYNTTKENTHFNGIKLFSFQHLDCFLQLKPLISNTYQLT